MTELDDAVVDHVDPGGRLRPDGVSSRADARLHALGRARSGATDSSRLTRRGRVRKWDRSVPPHDWRWWVGNVGKALIAIGVLMFGFVAYQLWGTGIETARAQRALENEFEELLETAPPVPEPVTVTFEPADSSDAPPADVGTTDSTATGGALADEAAAEPAPEPPDPAGIPVLPAASQNIPEVEDGDAIARIEIPRIGVDDIVVAGVSTGDLKKGPGHFPDTPLPGQLGNSAIAGHRTTYGQPFHDVDDLEPGDEIVVTTLTGKYVYRVTGQQIVSPSAYEVVATTDPTRATLTLTSCHPKWTAKQRIVVSSELDSEASAIVGEPVINYGRPPDQSSETATELPAGADTEDPASGADPTPPEAADPASSSGDPTGTLVELSTVGVGALGTEQANEGIADAFAEGWFSDPAANLHVLFWGLLLALIGVGSYLVSRRLRHDWAGVLVGIVPFVVTLYFFFQNVNRLLPPNL